MNIDLKELKEFVKRELNSPRSPINKGLVLEVLPAGSFLYGLMTEKSDIDLIAITLPSFSDVLFTKRSIEKTTDFEYKGHRLEINVISITDFFSYIVGGRPPMFVEAIIAYDGELEILKTLQKQVEAWIKKSDGFANYRVIASRHLISSYVTELKAFEYKIKKFKEENSDVTSDIAKHRVSMMRKNLLILSLVCGGENGFSTAQRDIILSPIKARTLTKIKSAPNSEYKDDTKLIQHFENILKNMNKRVDLLEDKVYENPTSEFVYQKDVNNMAEEVLKFIHSNPFTF